MSYAAQSGFGQRSISITLDPAVVACIQQKESACKGAYSQPKQATQQKICISTSTQGCFKAHAARKAAAAAAAAAAAQAAAAAAAAQTEEGVFFEEDGEGMSTTTKALIGVGVLAAVGGVYFLTQGK